MAGTVGQETDLPVGGQGAAEDLVAQTDTGARDPSGFVGKVLIGLCIVWSLFQIYIASELPFILQEYVTPLLKTVGLDVRFVLGSVKSRRVHLAFAMILAALAYPLFKNSPRKRVPGYDWGLAALGIIVSLYAVVLQDQIAVRSGLPTNMDMVISAVGLIVLMICTFRSLGLPLVIVVSVFLVYVFFGDQSFIPDVIRWKGASFGKAMWHFWMQEEGAFGKPIEVSATLIFLFVLFGAILEKAGAGNYFIKVAFALLGHLRGGPAKAAVVASAMSGLYSGSSIANVVTTGTFTIPLMKRTGFSAEKAGAVEVASSTNGQLTPPVMGAAAFLIAEFTGISYFDLIRHAFLPAIISYIALLYIVHLEALKMGLKGLPKPPTGRTAAQSMLLFLTGFIVFMVLCLVVYYGLGWVKVAFPNMSFTTAVVAFMIAYLVLIGLAARHDDLVVDPPDAPIDKLPPAGATAITGLYFILPIFLLIWSIMIERLSAGLAAYWATLAMIFITFTQHPIKAAFRKTGNYFAGFKRGFGEVVDGLIGGARSMISIAVATGAAGIIVGTIGLTGAHQVIGEFVEFLSGGNLMVMLILVAVMSLVLGMGLPTTANYIVVSSLMAPVILTVGAQNGLVLPMVAAHMFVFYFGILADDTPPVGLAAFAAAAISGGDPIKTGIQGFAYDIRTAVLPFLFVFNTELLLIDVTWTKGIVIFIVAVVAMLLFAAATQGYFFAKSRLWESAALLLITFTLFRPGFWLDMVDSPYLEKSGAEVSELARSVPQGEMLRVRVSGPDFDDEEKTLATTILVPMGDPGDGIDRLDAAGLTVIIEDGVAKLDEPFQGTPFFQTLSGFDYYSDQAPVQILTAGVPAERMPKEIFYIPALILLGIVILFQRRRQTVPAF
jgi:TRAP transporter 4TM/12TM fusion protein